MMDVLDAQRWSYVPDVPDDTEQIRELLEGYSKIPPTNFNQHLLRVRDDGWKVSKFPCIGRWNFLGLLDPKDPRYQQALFRLNLSGSRDVLLDLGCCVGQVIRQFRADGVDGAQLMGTDVEPRFIDIGYDLFRDIPTLQATFVIGDMLDPQDDRLLSLQGKVTIIHAASFFHLFTWTQQLYVGIRLVSFLKKGTKNALIFGKQIGATDTAGQSTLDSSPYLHDQGSFQALWDEVGKITGTKWSVDMEYTGDMATRISGVSKYAAPVQFTIYQIS